MANVRVKVIGDRALAAGLRRAGRELGELEPPTRRAARTVEQTARRLAPKRTGRLAAGTRSRAAGGLGTVSNSVRYAGYQEYGTSVMRAQQFLRPALYGTDIEEIYEDHAQRAIRHL